MPATCPDRPRLNDSRLWIRLLERHPYTQTNESIPRGFRPHVHKLLKCFLILERWAHYRGADSEPIAPTALVYRHSLEDTYTLVTWARSAVKDLAESKRLQALPAYSSSDQQRSKQITMTSALLGCLRFGVRSRQRSLTIWSRQSCSFINRSAS